MRENDFREDLFNSISHSFRDYFVKCITQANGSKI